MAGSSTSLLTTSVASASSLIALQLLSRLTTFALNQALFRLASPTAYGAASIQLDLVLSTILFLSREGVRGALLRGPSLSQPTIQNEPQPSQPRNEPQPRSETQSQQQSQQPQAPSQPSKSQPSILSAPDPARTSNLAFLPVLAGIPLALGTAVIFARAAGAELQAQPHFHTAVALYALAAVGELLSEPLYNFAMTSLQIPVRVRAEGLGVTAKSLATFLILLYDSRKGTGSLALVAFALGQLVYSTVVFLTYIFYLGDEPMWPRRGSLPPSSSSEKSRSDSAFAYYFDPTALQLSFTLTLQSLVKHFLTEGDKLILSWFSPLRDQGGYAIAVNYGSLIARILFQPIEETLRVFFSRTLGSTPSPQSLTIASETLASLLLAQTTLGLLLVTFGTAYLPFVLPLLLPPAYLATSAPSVLAAWVWYVPVLAANGALEAFLASVARPGELNAQSRWMIGFSALYIGAALVFYRAGLGDASLVYANIVNLSARIVYCMRFAVRYFASTPTPSVSPPSDSAPTTKTKPAAPTSTFTWNAILPPASLVLACSLSSFLVSRSERHFGVLRLASKLGRRALLNQAVQAHVAIGAALALVCAGVWWVAVGQGVVGGLGGGLKGRAKKE